MVAKQRISRDTTDSSMMSTTEIAEELGVSPQAISHCLRNAIKKAGRNLAAQGLEPEDLFDDVAPINRYSLHLDNQR